MATQLHLVIFFENNTIATDATDATDAGRVGMNVRPASRRRYFLSLTTIIKLFFQFDFRRRGYGQQIVTQTMLFVKRGLIKRIFINNTIILTLNTRLLLNRAASKPTSNICVYL